MLLADTAEDVLLILDPPLSAVDVEFDESGVEELFEEDFKGAVDGVCCDVGVDNDEFVTPCDGFVVGVDDDNVDKLVTLTVDDEFVANVIVNSIMSKIQRNPRSILVMKTFHEKYNKCKI